ncbi:MAG: cbb3-type cytochrome oxidase assembly protein CcoS [Gammaproteobacteria bacterium]
MEVLYLLIPVSLVFVGLIAWVFLWAVRSGQFDDMEGPAHQILMDDDGPVSGQQSKEDADEDAGKQSSRPE